MSGQALWTLQAMREAMHADARGPMPEVITGLSIDSRTIGAGEAYFAIKGDIHDGHAFVEAALKNGAGVAVVESAQADKFAGLPVLVVPDVLDGLRQLARVSRARLKAKVIAVTGSVGKTSTKEALRCVLAAQGSTHAAVASFNNHWGVPLSLARCPADVSYGVFEIGMNHAGEIEPLVQMVRPHVAVITTIEPVHLEYLGSIEAIADAKAEIFSGVEPGGAAVLKLDNPQFPRLRDAAQNAGIKRIVTFGEHAAADARLLDVSLHATCSAVHANILGHDVTYKIGMPGRHMAMNSIAVLAAASVAGADLAQSALALSQMQAPVGRGARIVLGVSGGEALLIDESYNANPASMPAALSVLGKAGIGPRGRRIAILGDMLELGPTGAELHAALAESVRANAIDLVFCCGPLMRSLWEALPSNRRGGYADSSAALEQDVANAVRAGDALMIKGSLGMKMKLIVEALKRRFPTLGAFDDVAV
jgi:UDP-N-acetylmuramoyl-tripeptide--D-alanyl-D-alanine ligase